MSVLQNPGDFQAAKAIREGTGDITAAVKQVGERILEGPNKKDTVEGLRKIAEKISDPKIKKEVLDDLTVDASVTDIKAAAEKIRTSAKDLDANNTALLDGVRNAP